MQLAARDGDVQRMRALLRAGVDVDAGSANGITPLMEAAIQGHLAATRLLLNHGAAVDAATSSGITPLMGAASVGNVDVLRLLLSKGAAMDAAAHTSGLTALMLATARNRPDCARVLLDAGVDVNASEIGGNTALHLAASYDLPDVVLLLLDAGAAVNAQTHAGLTPLHIAAIGDSHPVAELLLSRGADVNTQYPPDVKPSADTPLQTAAKKGHVAMVQLLAAHGAALESRGISGHTALYLAAKARKFDAAVALFQLGADWDAVTEDVLQLPGGVYAGLADALKKLMAERRLGTCAGADAAYDDSYEDEDDDAWAGCDASALYKQEDTSVAAAPAGVLGDADDEFYSSSDAWVNVQLLALALLLWCIWLTV